MEKSEQSKETTKGMPMKILARRNAVSYEENELDPSTGFPKDSDQNVDKSDKQSFQALASDVSQKTRGKAAVSENLQKKLSSKENLQR